MVNMYQLWMPILLSAGLVFIASSIIWMVLPYHKTDVVGTPDENALADALRRQKMMPGQYAIPWCPPEQRNSPEFLKKAADGPVAMITIRPAGGTGMGPMLAKWLVYLIVITSAVAYVAGRTMGPGQTYLAVFRVVGTVAFLALGGAHAIYGIFWGRPWSIVWKDTFDAFVYGCLTAGAFGWLWPR